jgi:hypothetical protein
MSAYLDAGVRSYIPKETPDIGCGKVNTVTSTELINLNLLCDGCIGEYDHLRMSAILPGRGKGKSLPDKA